MDALDYAVLILSFAIFFYVVTADIQGIIKFVVSVAVLYGAGEWFRRKYNLSTELIFILLKSRKGLGLIQMMTERIPYLWEFLGDVAFAAAFGATAIYFMRWRSVFRRVVSVSAAFIVISGVMLIYPAAIGFLMQNIGLTQQAGAASSEASPFLVALPYAFGLAGVAYFSVITAAGGTLYKIVLKLLGSGEIIKQGATLILPGINIPLIEGILALVVVLIVHEVAHAIQAVLGGIPLRSSGIVLFGVLPIGAFVEPDERKLNRSDPRKKVRLAASGPFSNFFFAFVFAILFFNFLSMTADKSLEGCSVVAGVIERGTVITSVNGVPGCMVNIPPNSDITLQTNGDAIKLHSDENGKIGILYVPVGKYFMTRYYPDGILQFFYNFLGLTFSLNIVVGLINLLPIFLFDGSLIVKGAVGDNNIITKFLLYSTTAAFIILLLPAVL